MAKKTLFDYLNAIYYKKDIPYDKKVANGYILTLWLSHDRGLLDLSNEINKYLFKLPDEAVYSYFFDKVPKGKRFIKYVKKEKVDKKKQKEIDELVKIYNISEEEAKKCLID